MGIAVSYKKIFPKNNLVMCSRKTVNRERLMQTVKGKSMVNKSPAKNCRAFSYYPLTLIRKKSYLKTCQ